MQWKLAPRREWAKRFHEWAMRRGFPILLKWAPRWPRWFNFLGARFVIWVVMAVYPKPKGDIDRNLSRILASPVGSRAVTRARRQMLRNFAYYWVDLFRFSGLPPEELRGVLAETSGLDNLKAAVAQGRGVVLLTAHLGNWELGGAFLRDVDLPLSVVYVPDQSPTAEYFRQELRGQIDIEEIPIDPRSELSSLPILRALKEGRVVAMQGDRDFNDRGLPVPFFGEELPFPLGPCMLARMTGALVVPTFIAYADDYRFVIEMEEAIEVPQGPDRTADAEAAVIAWVAVLERAVRRWPTQWYTFFDYWQAGREAIARRHAEDLVTEPARRREAV